MAPKGVRWFPALSKRRVKTGVLHGPVVRFSAFLLFFDSRSSFGRRSLLRGCCWGRNPDCAGRHLSRSIHTQLVNHFSARSQVGSLPLRQPRDVKKYIPPASFRTQKAKAFFFEIRNDRTHLLRVELATLGGGLTQMRRSRCLITDSLLQKSQIIFR